MQKNDFSPMDVIRPYEVRDLLRSAFPDHRVSLEHRNRGSWEEFQLRIYVPEMSTAEENELRHSAYDIIEEKMGKVSVVSYVKMEQVEDMSKLMYPDKRRFALSTDPTEPNINNQIFVVSLDELHFLHQVYLYLFGDEAKAMGLLSVEMKARGSLIEMSEDMCRLLLSGGVDMTKTEFTSIPGDMTAHISTTQNNQSDFIFFAHDTNDPHAKNETITYSAPSTCDWIKKRVYEPDIQRLS